MNIDTGMPDKQATVRSWPQKLLQIVYVVILCNLNVT